MRGDGGGGVFMAYLIESLAVSLVSIVINLVEIKKIKAISGRAIK
jgi:hypothetical protein